MSDTILVPDTYVTYVCSGGPGQGSHEVAAPKVLRKCPSYWLGSPCKGQLVRVGKGSRVAGR